tara:strand:+ start:1177 stop:1596 length:420 start_codon:yes stop_codon:yes gene_type:complete
MRVDVIDGAVTCPNCSHGFEVAQNKSVGATYAKKWWKISVFLQEFLHWWYSSGYKDGKYEKSTLRKAFSDVATVNVTEDAFNARMSELVGAGTSFAPALVHKTSGTKSSTRHTTSAPKYSLNIPRVAKVLELGGILENE